MVADEVRVDASRVPPAVHQTIRQSFPGAKVQRYTRDRDQNGVVYEATLQTDRGIVDVSISPEGKIVLREEEIDKSALPETVAKALAASPYGSDRVIHVERVFERQDVDPRSFEIVVRHGSRFMELTYDPAGRLIAQHRENPPSGH